MERSVTYRQSGDFARGPLRVLDRRSANRSCRSMRFARFMFWVGVLVAEVAGGQNHTTPFLDGTFRAIVIGNNDYGDSDVWSRLTTAIRGAEALADVLETDYGFGDVKLLRNATRPDILGALDDLYQRAEDPDSILVYYAGHGYFRQNTREGFWIPVDAEGRDDWTFVRNSTLRVKLALLAERARHVLLIVESCFSSALLRQNLRSAKLIAGEPSHLENFARQRSVQILTAGGLEYVDDAYRNTEFSLFTYFLLDSLSAPEESYVDASQLFHRVREAVRHNGQTPEFGFLVGARHEGGEFLFKARSEVGGDLPCKLKTELRKMLKSCAGQSEEVGPDTCAVLRVIELLARGDRAAEGILRHDLAVPEGAEKRLMPGLEIMTNRAIDFDASLPACARAHHERTHELILASLEFRESEILVRRGNGRVAGMRELEERLDSRVVSRLRIIADEIAALFVRRN